MNQENRQQIELLQLKLQQWLKLAKANKEVLNQDNISKFKEYKELLVQVQTTLTVPTLDDTATRDLEAREEKLATKAQTDFEQYLKIRDGEAELSAITTTLDKFDKHLNKWAEVRSKLGSSKFDKEWTTLSEEARKARKCLEYMETQTAKITKLVEQFQQQKEKLSSEEVTNQAQKIKDLILQTRTHVMSI